MIRYFLILCIGFLEAAAAGCASGYPLNNPVACNDNIDLKVIPRTGRIGACGVQASTSVLEYYRHKYPEWQALQNGTGPEKFEKQSFVSVLDMIIFLRKNGLQVRWGPLTEHDLISSIKYGNPVIIVIPASGYCTITNSPVVDLTHCWVVRGINERRKIFLVNDPENGPYEISYSDLDALRKCEGHLGIVCKLQIPRKE
jgi:hypothetical protein